MVTHERGIKNHHDTAPPTAHPGVSPPHVPLQHRRRSPELPRSFMSQDMASTSSVCNAHFGPLNLNPQRPFTAKCPPLQGWVSCLCIRRPPLDPVKSFTTALNQVHCNSNLFLSFIRVKAH